MWVSDYENSKNILRGDSSFYKWETGFLRIERNFFPEKDALSINREIVSILSCYGINFDGLLNKFIDYIQYNGPSFYTRRFGHLICFEFFKDFITGGASSVDQLLVEYIESFLIPSDVAKRKLNRAEFAEFEKRLIESINSLDFKSVCKESFLSISLENTENSRDAAEVLRRLTLASVGFLGAAVEWLFIDASVYPIEKGRYKEFCLESLRYHSPAWRLSRKSLKNFTLSENIDIYPGDEILISVMSAMRDADIFKEPNYFSVDRWVEENKEREILSFGLGRRICPAKSFSLNFLEKLTEIISDFELIFKKRKFSSNKLGTLNAPPRGKIEIIKTSI